MDFERVEVETREQNVRNREHNVEEIELGQGANG